MLITCHVDAPALPPPDTPLRHYARRLMMPMALRDLLAYDKMPLRFDAAAATICYAAYVAMLALSMLSPRCRQRLRHGAMLAACQRLMPPGHAALAFAADSLFRFSLILIYAMPHFMPPLHAAGAMLSLRERHAAAFAILFFATPRFVTPICRCRRQMRCCHEITLDAPFRHYATDLQSARCRLPSSAEAACCCRLPILVILLSDAVAIMSALFLF